MKFKPGELVRVKGGTVEPGMPAHRYAVILEEHPESKSYTKIYSIIFLGTEKPHKFHEMFLESVNESR